MKRVNEIEEEKGYYSNIPITHYDGSIAYDLTTGEFIEGTFYFYDSKFDLYEEYLFLNQNKSVSVLATNFDSAIEQLKIDFPDNLNTLDESFLVIKIKNSDIWNGPYNDEWLRKVETIYNLIFLNKDSSE